MTDRSTVASSEASTRETQTDEQRRTDAHEIRMQTGEAELPEVRARVGLDLTDLFEVVVVVAALVSVLSTICCLGCCCWAFFSR